ncbi:BZ3500_MvSof-1268-A1-R1_Chr7-1g09157 [Microbotryum saponariae]|uniref:BZ3500_MvSof-1268-A1-R1_Chr7-1g09157 protein n=1 Tax=Microbotryum saponariae TaxID=289078 RepID=A0A2X0LUI6_9BASI|nr:BZ3500_MvSof-1268-A1-R1_Chr7-1g09157 [Microbotryum saponariae]
MLRRKCRSIVPPSTATLETCHIAAVLPAFLLPAFAIERAVLQLDVHLASDVAPSFAPMATTSSHAQSDVSLSSQHRDVSPSKPRLRSRTASSSSWAIKSSRSFSSSAVTSQSLDSSSPPEQSHPRVWTSDDSRTTEHRIGGLAYRKGRLASSSSQLSAIPPRYNSQGRVYNPNATSQHPKTHGIDQSPGALRDRMHRLAEPANRSELLRAIHQAPVSDWGDNALYSLLELKNHTRRLERLDDIAPVAALSTLGIAAGQPTFSLQLLRNSMDAILLRYGNDPKEAIRKVSKLVEQPLRRLRHDKSFATALSVTNPALARNCFTPVVLKNHLRALYELDRYPEAIRAFHMFEEHGLEPDAASWDDYVGAHLHHSDVQTAQAVLAEKIERGHGTTSNTVLTLLDGMYRYGGSRVMEDRALEDVTPEALKRSQAVSQDVRVLNKIIAARFARRDAAGALQVFQRYFDVSPELRSRVAEAFTIYSPDSQISFDHYQPTPDLATLAIITKALARTRQFETALSFIVEESQQPTLGLVIDDHTIAVIVLCLVERQPNGLAEASRFLQALPHGEGRVELVGSASRTVNFPRFEPSGMAFETLLAATLRQTGLTGAKSLLERLVETHSNGSVSVSEGTITILVEYLAQQVGQIVEAASLIIRLWELSSDRGNQRPSLKNVSALLRGALQSAKNKSMPSRDAITLTRAVLPPNLLPPASDEESGRPYQSIIGPDAAKIRASLVARVLQPDRTTSELLLETVSPVNSMVNDTEHMWEHLQSSILSRGIRPTYRHLDLILRAYIHLGDPAGARRALDRGLNHLLIEAHPALYATLINGLTLCGDLDGALQVYAEMGDRGIDPNRRVYVALVIGFIRQRKHDAARMVLEEAKQSLADQSIDTNPIFVGVEYRARIARDRFPDAVRWLHAKLATGQVEIDEVLARIVKRSWRWAKWKLNRRSRGLIEFKGGLPRNEWSDEEVAEIVESLEETWKWARTARAKRRQELGRGWNEAQKIWNGSRKS